MPKKFILTRTVTKNECKWLDKDVEKDEVIYECIEHDYGCVGPTGTACTYESNGGYPFFELPKDSLKSIE